MQAPKFTESRTREEIVKELSQRIPNESHLRCAINKAAFGCTYDEKVEKHFIEAYNEVCNPPPPWWADILD